MLAEFDTVTLLTYVAVLSLGAWFLAAATDNVIGSDGFGTIRNMIILVAGAFLGLAAADHLQMPVHNLAMRAFACAVGGFASLALLSVLKAFASRLHY